MSLLFKKSNLNGHIRLYLSCSPGNNLDWERFHQEGVNLFALKQKVLESLKRLVRASSDGEQGFERDLKGKKRRGNPSYVDDTSENLQNVILQGESVIKELQNGDACYLILIGWVFLCFLLSPFPQELN